MENRTAARTNFRAGMFHLMVLYIVWGSTYLAMRVGVSGQASFAPFTMGSIRVLAAGGLLLLWAVWRRHTVRLTRHALTTLFASSMLLWVGGNGLVLWAEQFANSGYAALMVGTSPLWTAIFESILDRRMPSPLLILSLVVGFAGIGLLNVPAILNHAPTAFYASLALMLAPISWSMGTLLQKRNPVQFSPLVSSGYQQIFAGFGFLILAWTLHEPWHHPSSHAWMALVYLILFGSVLAFTSFGAVLAILPSSLVMTYAYVNPVIALLLGFVILQEPLTAWNLAGTALILVSVAGVFRANRRPTKPVLPAAETFPSQPSG